jgi:enamine deaminase RidA (YjgF/YER057c/UK114 family)
MSALANLSKYLGVYQHWKAIAKNAGLKWEKKVSLDIVLDIMNTNLQDCWTWLKQVLQILPKEYGTVLVFTALTGLRPSESVNSTRLISELDEEKKLGDYLNQELLMLEHFRYGELFLRRYKNAYISFVTPQLLRLVTTYKPKINYSTLSTKIKRLKEPIRTKQLRKYYATTLREHLPTEAIDLLQGRINRSVFLRYYYKPFLKDVRDKTLKGIEPLQNELLELLF